MESDSLRRFLLTELKCKNCKKYMTYTIIQCSNGHNTCSRCYDKCLSCNFCLEPPIQFSRNHILETAANYIEFPCLYREAGCSEMLSKQNVIDHQKNCVHGPYRCPQLGSHHCQWQGNAEEIYEHVQQDHNFLQVDISPGKTKGINIKEEHHNGLLFSAEGELFFRVFANKDGEFCGYIKYLGPDKKAKLFRYKMQLHSHKTGINTMFKGPLHMCTVSEENILSNNACFRMPNHAMSKILDKEPEICVETSIYISDHISKNILNIRSLLP